MPFLVIGSTAVSVGLDGPTREVAEIGHRQRAFDGTLRSTIRTLKGEWDVSTIPLLRSVADTIYATITATAEYSAYGDLLGVTSTAPLTVQVAEIEWQHIGSPGSSGRVVLNFRVMEV